jgi:hypothetical protein
MQAPIFVFVGANLGGARRRFLAAGRRSPARRPQ